MKGKPKKPPREKDITSRYLSGGYDEDRAEQGEKFSQRSKHAVQNKLEKTAAMRAAEEPVEGDVNSLPVGEVVQVYSLFNDVEYEPGKTALCVVRKTLAKASETAIVVGDRVRYRLTGSSDDQGRPEGVIEQVLPRATVLTRAESFKGIRSHPIVANAEQMLIVASLLFPAVKWGLVDRMLVAAQSGKLKPILCLNKLDLGTEGEGAEAAAVARDVLIHYQTLGVTTLVTSAEERQGLDELKDLLRGKTTVLAGHSGVGKSSLINAIQPDLDLRVGRVSDFTEKGTHTTTSARRYVLHIGGAVIDTPGVKHFGLWGVTAENLSEFFPDVAAGTAPEWRKQSMERIRESLCD
jgi:ribosome biogenesis GTPase